MKTYYGTKALRAKPMTRDEYNELRGWPTPPEENGNDEGYLVEYLDGGKANVEGFDGYVSWSPKDVFERSYQPKDALTFGHALKAMMEGDRVARAKWEDKSVFIEVDFAGRRDYPYFCMFDDARQWRPGWMPTDDDIFANDWQIISSDIKTLGASHEA